jgi:erythromycin esterase
MFWGLVVFGLLGCTGQSNSVDDLEAQKADSHGFIEWVGDHATAIESLSSSSTKVHGEFFRDAIGQAQVVGLGESRHDSREQLLMKGLLVRFLVEEMGFRALVLESLDQAMSEKAIERIEEIRAAEQES